MMAFIAWAGCFSLAAILILVLGFAPALAWENNKILTTATITGVTTMTDTCYYEVCSSYSSYYGGGSSCYSEVRKKHTRKTCEIGASYNETSRDKERGVERR